MLFQLFEFRKFTNCWLIFEIKVYDYRLHNSILSAFFRLIFSCGDSPSSLTRLVMFVVSLNWHSVQWTPNEWDCVAWKKGKYKFLLKIYYKITACIETYCRYTVGRESICEQWVSHIWLSHLVCVALRIYRLFIIDWKCFVADMHSRSPTLTRSEQKDVCTQR